MTLRIAAVSAGLWHPSKTSALARELDAEPSFIELGPIAHETWRSIRTHARTMSQKTLISVAGSPGENSRSSRLLFALAHRLESAGAVVQRFSLESFDPRALLWAKTDDPSIAHFIEQARSAKGLLLGTPVYKASYTGSLKAIVDLLPPDAFLEKFGFGLATAKQRAHVEATAVSFSRLFAFFRVAHEVPAATFLDEDVFDGRDPSCFSASVEKILDDRAKAILAALG